MRICAVSIGLLIVMVIGCKSPLHAVTESRVIMHSSPVEDRGPLVEMPVIVGPENNGRKIALIDVDGLLLNVDMTGLASMGENPVAVFREKLDRVAADPCYCAIVCYGLTAQVVVSRPPISCGETCTASRKGRVYRWSPA